jgi:hypothetical protein
MQLLARRPLPSVMRHDLVHRWPPQHQELVQPVGKPNAALDCISNAISFMIGAYWPMIRVCAADCHASVSAGLKHTYAEEHKLQKLGLPLLGPVRCLLCLKHLVPPLAPCCLFQIQLHNTSSLIIVHPEQRVQERRTNLVYLWQQQIACRSYVSSQFQAWLA